MGPHFNYSLFFTLQVFDMVHASTINHLAPNVQASSGVDSDGDILPSKPKFCQCWFMELDDSVMTQWAMDVGKRVLEKNEIIQQIDAWLPCLI